MNRLTQHVRTPRQFSLFCIAAWMLSACSHVDSTHPGDGQHGELGISSKYLGSYSINDEQHRSVVEVTVTDEARTIVSNAMPNHTTGVFPNKANPNRITPQKRKWVLPMDPEFTGQASWVREPGVAINGVKFEPETNERVICESGEVYRIEAVQDMLDLGLDFNNAHVQPTGEYHYHGVSQNLVDFSDQGSDLVHVGFAADGFLIVYSKSNAFRPSYRLKSTPRTGTNCVYSTRREQTPVDIGGSIPDGTYVSDWEYIEGFGDLDQCDGTKINGAYVYIASDDYPYVGRCLNGRMTEKQRSRRKPPPDGKGKGRGRGDGKRTPRSASDRF